MLYCQNPGPRSKDLFWFWNQLARMRIITVLKSFLMIIVLDEESEKKIKVEKSGSLPIQTDMCVGKIKVSFMRTLMIG